MSEEDKEIVVYFTFHTQTERESRKRKKHPERHINKKQTVKDTQRYTMNSKSQLTQHKPKYYIDVMTQNVINSIGFKV